MNTITKEEAQEALNKDEDMLARMYMSEKIEEVLQKSAMGEISIPDYIEKIQEILKTFNLK